MHLRVLSIYYMEVAALDWLRMCWASEALSGVAFSSLLPLSMAQ